MRASFIILLSLILQPCALFASQSIATIGGWKVIKDTDSMTDKTSCLASFSKHRNVIMTSDDLVISMSNTGGMRALKYRFDKEEATGFMPTTGNGRNFWLFAIDRILIAERLQVQIQPVVGNTIVSFDIDLRRARDIHQILVSDRCK